MFELDYFKLNSQFSIAFLSYILQLYVYLFISKISKSSRRRMSSLRAGGGCSEETFGRPDRFM